LVVVRLPHITKWKSFIETLPAPALTLLLMRTPLFVAALLGFVVLLVFVRIMVLFSSMYSVGRGARAPVDVARPSAETAPHMRTRILRAFADTPGPVNESEPPDGALQSLAAVNWIGRRVSPLTEGRHVTKLPGSGASARAPAVYDRPAAHTASSF
jgi:hypothetical protein